MHVFVPHGVKREVCWTFCSCSSYSFWQRGSVCEYDWQPLTVCLVVRGLALWWWRSPRKRRGSSTRTPFYTLRQFKILLCRYTNFVEMYISNRQKGTQRLYSCIPLSRIGELFIMGLTVVFVISVASILKSRTSDFFLWKLYDTFAWFKKNTKTNQNKQIYHPISKKNSGIHTKIL